MTHRTRRIAFSSSTAYLRPLIATTGHTVFLRFHLRVPPKAKTRLVDFRKLEHLISVAYQGPLLPTFVCLRARRTYSFVAIHFWMAGLPATLGRTFCGATIFGRRCQNRAQLQVPSSPTRPITLPCRSRSFLPSKGHNEAQRAPSLPGHHTRGQDFSGLFSRQETKKQV